MPDNQDYAELARLLQSPRSWSPSEAAVARSLLRGQEQVLAAWHPKDVRRCAAMQDVVDDLREAVSEYERHCG